jgi:hypothetical protein
MMPLVSNLIQKIRNIILLSRDSQSNEIYPNNLVRLCKSRAEFISIINEAINSPDQNWEQQLIDRVIQYILDEKSSGISVYRVDTLDPLDCGHALAVVAEGISRDDFQIGRGKKRKSSCTRGSLIIPTAYLPITTSYEFTPQNNLNFCPANDHHFDLTIKDTEEFAISLLNGINKRIISWSFLGNEKPYEGSYRVQASIAYSNCLQTFGKLNASAPPSDWTDGEKLTASEQIDILRYLAQTHVVDSPS